MQPFLDEWWIPVLFVGILAFPPFIIITVIQCARVAAKEPERIKEEIFIGIGEFVACFLEISVLVSVGENGVGSFLIPMIDWWRGAILLFVSLYLLNRIIIKLCIRILFVIKPSQPDNVRKFKDIIPHLTKAGKVVFLLIVISVVAVFSLFRTVKVDEEQVQADFENQYSEYILCEIAPGYKLMFTWNYYSLKKKVREDLQTLLEEAKAEKEWMVDYKLTDLNISIYVDSTVEVGTKAKSILKNSDSIVSCYPAYYVLLGDYGSQVMDCIVMLETLEGVEGMDKRWFFECITFYYPDGTEVGYREGW